MGRTKEKRRDSAVHRAPLMLKLSKSGDATMTVQEAMKFSGFNTIERGDKVYQKQICSRRRDHIEQTTEIVGMKQKLNVVLTLSPP
jgi:hypothetical protein